MQLQRFSSGLAFSTSAPTVHIPSINLTENDGHEHDGPSKLQDIKLQDNNNIASKEITLQSKPD